MNYILLFISLCLGVGKNILSKAGNKEFSGMVGLMEMNIITATMGMFIYAVSGLEISVIKNPMILGMAVLYGVLTLGSQSLYIMAVRKQSVAVCSLIYSSCFIIPTIYSMIYYQENITVIKLLGILLMLSAIIMVSLNSNNKSGIFATEGLGMALLAMICAGFTGILQKYFGTIHEFVDFNDFLFVSFVSMLFFSVLVRRRLRKLANASMRVSFGKVSIGLALCVVVANYINLYLSGALPGLVFYPVVNGGCIMLTAVFSGAIFAEKLSWKVWLGIFVGIIAVFVIAFSS